MRSDALRVFAVLLSCMLLFACGSRVGRGTSGAADSSGDGAVHKAPRLDVPQPSAMLSDSARLDFIAAHYWDNFDFADTTWIADTAALEGTFTPWAQALAQLPQRKAADLTGALIRRGAGCPAMQLRLMEVAEYFWKHPNSPFRNEELYIPVLEAVVAAPGVDEVNKIRPQMQLEAARKNRPGMKAADFVYTTGSGRTGRLSGLGGDYTLVLFYNPGCPDCRRVEQYIAASEVFGPLVASKRMKVLAMYVDADFAAWRAGLPEMPRGWTVGCDPRQTITSEELYNLPAIPNLYLLDRAKCVVFKDAPVERIEAWLAEQERKEVQL